MGCDIPSLECHRKATRNPSDALCPHQLLRRSLLLIPVHIVTLAGRPSKRNPVRATKKPADVTGQGDLDGCGGIWGDEIIPAGARESACQGTRIVLWNEGRKWAQNRRGVALRERVAAEFRVFGGVKTGRCWPGRELKAEGFVKTDPKPTPKRPRNDPKTTPKRPRNDPKSTPKRKGRIKRGCQGISGVFGGYR